MWLAQKVGSRRKRRRTRCSHGGGAEDQHLGRDLGGRRGSGSATRGSRGSPGGGQRGCGCGCGGDVEESAGGRGAAAETSARGAPAGVLLGVWWVGRRRQGASSLLVPLPVSILGVLVGFGFLTDAFSFEGFLYHVHKTLHHNALKKHHSVV